MKEAMMESTPLFSVLTEAQRSIIAGRMSTETRRAGDLIYQQGRPATALYLIKSGWARLVTDQFAVLANLGAGSLLGEADTISGRNYATSSEAATDVTLWVLAANDLKAIMADYPDIGRAIKRAMGLGEEQAVLRHLRRLELLGGLSQDQLQEVAEHLQPARFTAGETIYRRGSEGDALYLVDQGQVQVATAAGAVNSIGAGETFGEGAFLTGETHSTEVRAQTDVVTWSLTRTDFESLAMRYPILALNLSRSVSRRLRERNMRPAASAQVAPPAPVIQRAPVAASTAVTVNKAADTATSWWGARSRGAKFRLIAMILLLIWLLGVAAPAIIISLLSRAPDVNASRSMARSYTTVADSAVLVALAADLPEETNPTYTPWPTETPIPTPTFTPTATPTETPLPTETPIPPTETPVPPTATPIPPTRTVVRQVVQQVAAQPALAAAVAPKAAPAPAPASTQYSVIELRRLEPCENRGNHHIFVTVVDGAGNPVDGVTLVQSPVGEIGNVLDKSVSGAKGPGKAEFVMWKHGEYAVYPTDDGANPGNTEVARSMNPNFVDEANCADGGGGNTLFHNSFAVTFRKNF